MVLLAPALPLVFAVRGVVAFAAPRRFIARSSCADAPALREKPPVFILFKRIYDRADEAACVSEPAIAAPSPFPRFSTVFGRSSAVTAPLPAQTRAALRAVVSASAGSRPSAVVLDEEPARSGVFSRVLAPLAPPRTDVYALAPRRIAVVARLNPI